MTWFLLYIIAGLITNYVVMRFYGKLVDTFAFVVTTFIWPVLFFHAPMAVVYYFKKWMES